MLGDLQASSPAMTLIRVVDGPGLTSWEDPGGSHSWAKAEMGLAI
jgi:hypothetical protein